LYQKSFLTRVSSNDIKRSPLKYPCLGMLSLDRECDNWKRFTPEREIIENSSMSLSPTLEINEKVEHFVKKKTYKHINLMCWIVNIFTLF